MDFNFAIPVMGYEVVRSMNVHPNQTKEEEWLVLHGWASDSSVDQYSGQFTPDCIVGMVDTVNSKFYRNVEKARSNEPWTDKRDIAPVAVDIEHSDYFTQQVGFVKRARAVYDLTALMIQRGAVAPVMEVEIWVDLEMSAGRDLRRSLDRGVELGLSVFGGVLDAKKVVNRATNKVVEQFRKIELRKVAITGKPVNKVTWVDTVRRSIGENMEVITVDAAAAPVEPEAPVEVLTPGAEQDIIGLGAAASNTVVRSEVSEGPLDPGALADLAGLGVTTVKTVPVNPVVPVAVVFPTVPVAPVAQLEAAVESVARSLAPVVVESVVVQPAVSETDATVQEWLVFRSTTEDAMHKVAELLAPLPDFIARSQASILSLEKQVGSLTAENARMSAAMAEGQGRRGVVARALGDSFSAAPAAAPLGADLSEADRAKVARQLTEGGDQVGAVKFLLGLLSAAPAPAPIINDPLIS